MGECRPAMPQNTPQCEAHSVMDGWLATSMADPAFNVKGCIFQQVP